MKGYALKIVHSFFIGEIVEVTDRTFKMTDRDGKVTDKISKVTDRTSKVTDKIKQPIGFNSDCQM
ncbi:hypothetical protein ACMGD3_09070 [Lysinibacillus sphaericus]|uniref:hypothetical protein n=1 Tax=Lysinibacillus sphaericus TaxID=1421 RepID=UPI001C5D5A6F